jgi:metal-responsive CopG/Arc/MetJ family transcriptional regulator
MRKSITVKRKKRGRPATGVDPLVGVRLPPALIAALDAWAKQEQAGSRSEAIRRILEWGLGHARPGRKRTERAAKASEMAGQEVDRVSDPSATNEERQLRKQRLIKGPKEFREMRNRGRTKG